MWVDADSEADLGEEADGGVWNVDIIEATGQLSWCLLPVPPYLHMICFGYLYFSVLKCIMSSLTHCFFFPFSCFHHSYTEEESLLTVDRRIASMVLCHSGLASI